MIQYGFYYDNSRCTGCKTCLFACHDHKEAAPDAASRRVYDLEGGTWEKAADGGYSTDCSVYHLSLACNHCSEPACVSACPTAAMHKEEGRGLVLVDQDRCTGCGSCVKACPYDAPRIDWRLGCAVKCDACEDLLDQGMRPICVTSCPLRALDMGPIEELRERYGSTAQIHPMPDPSCTKPNIVIRPSSAALDAASSKTRIACLQNPRTGIEANAEEPLIPTSKRSEKMRLEDAMSGLDARKAAELALVGSVLGPFFLFDPAQDHACLKPGLEAITLLDLKAAADEWPFVPADQAEKALAKMQAGLKDDLAHDALTWEYRRLFIGPAAKPAPPWGSVYTDKDGVVFGTSTLELRSWLRRLGIAIAKTESDEPEDHIGTMLMLLAWLSEEHPQLVAEFLANHLLTWSSCCLLKIEEAAQHPFYEGLARLARLSLEGAQEELGLLVE